MTLITGPVLVEVFARPGCDAAAATVLWLVGHGIPHKVSSWAMRNQTKHVSPAVTVWVGTGDTRHQRLGWEGHRTDMLAHAAKLNRTIELLETA